MAGLSEELLTAELPDGCDKSCMGQADLARKGACRAGLTDECEEKVFGGDEFVSQGPRFPEGLPNRD